MGVRLIYIKCFGSNPNTRTIPKNERNVVNDFLRYSKSRIR